MLLINSIKPYPKKEIREEEYMNNEELQETNIENLNEDYADGVVYDEDQEDNFD